MRIAFVITIVGMLASGESSEAQSPARQPPTAVARRFIDVQLSDSAFRHLRCVSAGVGDCPGGVLIVRGYRLGDGVRTPDTVRYAVEFQVVGIVGVSEGGPFFMPRSWVDSAEAAVRLADASPLVLLANHLEPGQLLLIYRTRSLAELDHALSNAGWAVEGSVFELPPGPCVIFRDPGGQRVAVYERVRPEVEAAFEGRFDVP